MRTWPKISVATTVFNEEEVLPELYRRVSNVLATLPGGPHELVLVNDGSCDGTAEVLEALAEADSRVTVVELSRNFGHQAALTAALDHVTGDVTIVMDGDLQDTPETIPQFLDEYRKGYDVVYAVRRDRKEHWLLRTAYSSFYRFIGCLADIKLPHDAGDFGLMSRRVVEVLKSSDERHRYLRGLRTWAGFRQIGVPVERAERHSGQSKYSLVKLLRLAFDGVFSFSLAPLRAATMIGGAAMAASLLFAVYCVYAKIVWDQSPSGFTALYVSMAFLAGVQMLFLGVIGEYIGRIYNEVKRRPLYVVHRILRSDDAMQDAQATNVSAKTPLGATPDQWFAEATSHPAGNGAI